LDADAGIIVLNDYANLFLLSKEMGKDLKRDIHIICGLWWSVEIPKLLCKIIFIILRNRVLYPKIKVSILCNTKREHKLLRLFGIDSVFCNHNCFIDENIFTNRPRAPKKYAAVYNAVLYDFKRHSLVAAIKGNVAFLTYRYENATYKNHLDNAALVEAYNESYTGLALSSVEGAMYASCEYLLCGIPVVSTRSKGGRDVFFDDYNSIIADAVPEQVYDIADTWDEWYVNKLRNEFTGTDLLVQLNDGPVNRLPVEQSWGEIPRGLLRKSAK
jgi:hypothetical protein